MKKLSKILYLAALILAILFGLLLVLSYISWKKLLLNPLVMVAPFSHTVKRLCIYCLLPAVLCAVLGFIVNLKDKK